MVRFVVPLRLDTPASTLEASTRVEHSSGSTGPSLTTPQNATTRVELLMEASQTPAASTFEATTRVEHSSGTAAGAPCFVQNLYYLQ